MPPRRGPGEEQAGPVDDGAEQDHAREAEPVAERARDERSDDVASGDDAEQRRGRPERLTEADGDVQTTNVRIPAKVPSQAVFATRNVLTSGSHESTLQECRR